MLRGSGLAPAATSMARGMHQVIWQHREIDAASSHKGALPPTPEVRVNRGVSQGYFSLVRCIGLMLQQSACRGGDGLRHVPVQGLVVPDSVPPR